MVLGVHGEESEAESVYKVIEIIGTSPKSWAEAGKAAVERASKTLRDLRIAEVVEQDIQINDGKVELYRVKLNGDGAAIFRYACWDGPRRYRLETHRLAVRERADPGVAEDEEPRTSSDADLGSEKPKHARNKRGRYEQSDDGVSVVFLSGRINSRWDWSRHRRYSLYRIELNCPPLAVKGR